MLGDEGAATGSDARPCGPSCAKRTAVGPPRGSRSCCCVLRRRAAAGPDSPCLPGHAAAGGDRLLAQCVQTAFSDGDPVAIGILRGAADQLESSALSVARRLEIVGSEFPFVLAGGIFRAVPWLEEELARRLSLASPRSRTILLDIEPAAGAVLLALAEARGGYHVPAYKAD